ncbi:predicted protein [Sparassis crispa]|uniref:Urea active transporter n=1 Tax=Sparassis crispa TaxID=139825 RepID=A0A401GRJ9_9APHY|nr:predicted protein [Sparassis crispa]GBE84789.1 predicted protein [Sparassis crispa]
MTTTEGARVLTQGVGYGVVLGIGLVFAVIMMGLSYLQNRYTTFKTTSSEEFNTASRSVKPGLIASGIVSAWTWAATLLQSSTVTYEWGLCGGYYYAAGATIQIFIMAVLAVRVKMIAPYCHTYLEIMQARYGNAAHFMFVTYGLVTNLIVSSMLLLGGSAVVNAFTGMNIYASNFLIPLGVMIYVILGGLRATFLCDFIHTTILMIIILYFFFYTYTNSALIGGLDGMYHLLQEAATLRPVAGNQGGSYLTLKSNTPAGVVTLLGKGGAVAMLILLFMAVTSAASSEMIATSSILTFDLYQIHFKPDAPPETLIKVSHIMVGIWAIIMSSVACLWNGIGISLNWLYLFAGTVYTSAVGPIVLTVLWRKQTRAAVFVGALGGLCIGITCWLVVAKAYYGELSITTTGEMYPMLAGNLGSCCSGVLISIIVTLIKPDNKFDWTETKKINSRGHALVSAGRPDEPQTRSSLNGPTSALKSEKNSEVMHVLTANDKMELDLKDDTHEDTEMLQKSLVMATWSSLAVTFILIFLIPIPMFLSHYVFSLHFFRAWVVISVLWLFVAALITSILPVWESRDAMINICRGIIRDTFGGRQHENMTENKKAAAA